MTTRLLAFALAAVTGSAQAFDYDWTAGDYATSALPNPLPEGDVVNAVGTASKSFGASTTVQGLLNWRSSASIGLGAGALLRIEGRFDLGSDGSFAPVGSGASVENLGIFRKSAGGGDFLFNAALANRAGGVLDAVSGRIVYRQASRFDAGSVFSGAGQHVFNSGVQQTYTFGGGFNAEASTLRWEWGRFVAAAAGTLTPQADITWAGGSIVGDWGNGAGRTLTAVDGSAGKVFEGSYVNAGTVAWNTGNTIGLQDAQLRNDGLFTVRDGAFSAAGVSKVENAGSFSKTAGSGDFAFNAALTNRAGGVLDAASGRMLYRASSRFDAGTVFTGAGQHVFTAGAKQTYTFGGDFAAVGNQPLFTLGDYVNAGAGTLRPDADLRWSGGSFVGAWGNRAGRTWSAIDGGGKTFDGSFVNEGTVLWDTTNTIGVVAGGSIVNPGRFEVRDGGIATAQAGFVFDNTGVFSKTQGSGVFRFRGALTNTGVIEALAGTVQLPDAWTNEGTLRGTAAFQSSRVTNAGLISAGLPSGAQQAATLSFIGALANAAGGFLDIDVGAGGVSDRLAVSGSVTLDGLMRVSPLAGYRAQLGDRFMVMSFASASGTLDGVLASGFGSGTAFRSIVEPTALWIEVTAVPEPATGVLLVCGLAWLRGRARAPRAR